VTILSVGCDNPECLERKESDALFVGTDGIIIDADQWEASLRQDAKLDGWIRDGFADFCSVKCLLECRPIEAVAKSLNV
jgi:hypothetical protein